MQENNLSQILGINVNEMDICPEFNLNWYKGSDMYSDGDVENDMIKIIMDNAPGDYTEAIYKAFSWPTYYHLTHIRENILNWYPVKSNASVLEIGCGFGAITHMLCDKFEKVTAVELSKRRATGTLLRCREKNNLKIIVGNLNDIEFEEKFDYITLIGVLEYQGKYTDSDNPFSDFLKTIKKLLKPEGKLLIAIENKCGAKYWCGAREDHTGVPFDGMNQYKISNGEARTFSRAELKELLTDSGYKNQFFYYPMPDYKLPSVIYSQDYLPQSSNLMNMIPYYVGSDDTLLIDEKQVYGDIIQNGVFEFFANSFLLECTNSDDEENRAIFASMSNKRCREYRIATIIEKEGRVEKKLLERELQGYNHLEQMKNNLEYLTKMGITVLEHKFAEKTVSMEFLKLPSLEDKILDAYKQKDKEQIFKYYDSLLEQILQSSEEAPYEENLIYALQIDNCVDKERYGKILKKGFLDLIPRNCFVKEKELIWIDQEWMLENLPAKYILFYGIVELYNSYSWVDNIVSLQEVAEKYSLVSVWKQFLEMNSTFYGMVMDQYHCECARQFMSKGINSNIQNIKKLMNI